MSGGAFLLSQTIAGSQLIPEDLGEDARAIARTVDEFWRRDVQPSLAALDRHDYDTARRLLRQAGSLGLTAMQIPERFGGLALALPSLMLAIEHLAEDPSYLGWHLGQSGLGAVPLVYYGTEDQRRQFLPGIASGEIVAAFALTEPHAGSDALASRTRADLSADGREYVLNGQKAWITNGGAADLFTVFAKIGGEHFTAFLVERGAGVRSGAEERKMGLQGTSTTALYLDHVRVPAASVIGEVGRGHAVALTALNAARLEMGPMAIRGARRVLRASIEHVSARHAGGRPLAELGAIQEKLADMATRLFAAESAAWRAIGLVDAATRQPTLPHELAEAAAFDAHAIECAIVKVYASEMLDFVADEGVQIHGGYGFHRDYLVERAFRDARVNRIFEGTNEVNRLAIVNLLLKQARRGHLPLFEAMATTTMPEHGHASLDPAAFVRRLTLMALRSAHERFGDDLMAEQEIVMRLADLVIHTFVLQATSERARSLGHRGSALRHDQASIHAREAVVRAERLASEVVATVTGRSDTIEMKRRVARGQVRDRNGYLAHAYDAATPGDPET
jgi:alkylation response protein AidB-like acyl-CoA dehydrogenase